MANGIVCDGCGTSVAFDSANGRESESAEESAWITLSADNVRNHHACTRECAKQILDGQFGKLVEEAFETIAEIARAIRDNREQGENE